MDPSGGGGAGASVKPPSTESMAVVSPGNDVEGVMDIVHKGSLFSTNSTTEVGNRTLFTSYEGSDLIFPEPTVKTAVVAARAAVMASALSAMAAIAAVEAMSDECTPPGDYVATTDMVHQPSAVAPTWETSLEVKKGESASRHQLFPGPSPWPCDLVESKTNDVVVQATSEVQDNAKVVLEEDTAPAPANSDSNQTQSSGGGQKAKRCGPRGKCSPSWKQSWRPTCEHERCHKSPCFGFAGEKAAFCFQHKADGMINVRRAKSKMDSLVQESQRVPKSVQCRYSGGCSRVATYGFPAGRGSVSPPSSTSGPASASASAPSVAMEIPFQEKAGGGEDEGEDEDIATTCSLPDTRTDESPARKGVKLLPSDNRDSPREGQERATKLDGSAGPEAPAGDRDSGGRTIGLKTEGSENVGEAGAEESKSVTPQPEFCAKHAAPGMICLVANVQYVVEGSAIAQGLMRRRILRATTWASCSQGTTGGGDGQRKTETQREREKEKEQEKEPQAREERETGEGDGEGEGEIWRDGRKGGEGGRAEVRAILKAKAKAKAKANQNPMNISPSSESASGESMGNGTVGGTDYSSGNGAGAGGENGMGGHNHNRSHDTIEANDASGANDDSKASCNASESERESGAGAAEGSPSRWSDKSVASPKMKMLKEKSVVDQCPHTHSKHYCHGMCKLCYMKEYNRRTRAAEKVAKAEGDSNAVKKEDKHKQDDKQVETSSQTASEKTENSNYSPSGTNGASGDSGETEVLR